MPLNSHRKPQGTLLGMPYDWRRPNRSKVFARLWNPGGPMFSPKVFGWGWTLNLAHPGSWAVLGATALAVTLALIFA